ncbi:MAG TPA: pilus assembly protein PilP [Anaeromyxobacter sp.]
MIARRLLPLAVLAVLAACGSKPAPRPAAPAAVAAAPAPAQPAQPAAADAKKPAEPEWSYSSAGKRDPFRSFLSEIERGQGSLATRCATPLGRFELEQLKLVAVVTGLEDPVAMVEAPTGVGYSVRRGACIGKNGGAVAAVRSGELVVTEWAVRADGTRDRTQTVIRLPKEAALNLEE